jgi:hypothetical protein
MSHPKGSNSVESMRTNSWGEYFAVVQAVEQETELYHTTRRIIICTLRHFMLEE